MSNKGYFFSVDRQCLMRTFEKKTGNATCFFTISFWLYWLVPICKPVNVKKRKGISLFLSEGVEALSTNRKRPPQFL